MGHHADSRPGELALYRREIVLDGAPLRRQDSRVPGVVNVAEARLHLGGDVVVDLEEFLPPIRARRNVGIEAGANTRIAAGGRIRERNNVGAQDSGCVGIDGDDVAWVSLKLTSGGSRYAGAIWKLGSGEIRLAAGV